MAAVGDADVWESGPAGEGEGWDGVVFDARGVVVVGGGHAGWWWW